MRYKSFLGINILRMSRTTFTNHAEEKSLLNKINSVDIEIGSLYHHYRNPDQHYKIIEIGLNESDEEPMVIYKALYGDGITWIRSYNVWSEKVEYNGILVNRFSKV